MTCAVCYFLSARKSTYVIGKEKRKKIEGKRQRRRKKGNEKKKIAGNKSVNVENCQKTDSFKHQAVQCITTFNLPATHFTWILFFIYLTFSSNRISKSSGLTKR